MKKYLPWLGLSYAVMIPLFGIFWPRTLWRMAQGKNPVQPEDRDVFREALDLLDARGWGYRKDQVRMEIPSTEEAREFWFRGEKIPEATDEEVEEWFRNLQMSDFIDDEHES